MRNLTTPELAVTVDQFKRAAHLDLSAADDDLIIESYLRVGQELVETACARPMSPRTMEFTFVGGCWSSWLFPVRHIISVTKVEILGADDPDWVTVPADAYRLRRAYDAPELCLTSQADRIGSEHLDVRVTAEAGHENGDWPMQMWQAMVLVAKEYLEAGIAVEEFQAPQLTFAAHRLIRQVRYIRVAEFGGA